jgi:hypothetical protein
VLALLGRHRDLRCGDSPAQRLLVLRHERVPPPRPDGGIRIGRPSRAIRFAERRHRLVDTEIRGVSHHCRIVTYRNAPKAAVRVTT